MSESKAFAKTARLLTAKDYSRVFDRVDQRVSTKHFLILSQKNENLGMRLGIIVAKKHVKLAVERNRIKRVTREAFRLKQFPHNNIDLIVLAKRGCGDLNNDGCFKDLNYLFRKLIRRYDASQ